MHQRREPDGHAVRAAVLLLAYEQVDPAVVVFGAAEQLPESVFLDPVDLEVAEWLPVPAADDREAVFVAEVGAQELRLVLRWPRLAPGGVDPGVVHPPVYDVQVGRHVLELVFYAIDG